MRKILVFLLSIALTISSISVSAFAAENNDSQAGLNQEEAGNIALWYMANDIKDNKDSSWSNDTRISKIINLYDENDNIISYCFELKNADSDNGYIIVSATGDNSLIQEFAYTEKPLYYNANINNYDKVYYTAPMEYAIEKDKKLFSKDRIEVKRKEMKSSVKHDKNKYEKNRKMIDRVKKNDRLKINEWMCGYNGQISGQSGYGGITNPYTYCNDRYGTGWTLKDSKYLSVTPRLQNDLESGANNCTLSSIAMVFDFHRARGEAGIPSSISTLYKDIQTIAKTYGYSASAGTDPTKADDIVTDLWTKYGHTTGRGNNDYLLLWSTVKDEIGQNRPFVFNIAFGYYSNHSICVTGYSVYKGPNWYNSDTQFLKVNDNWTTSARYIDLDAWGSSSVGSFTKVLPE